MTEKSGEIGFLPPGNLALTLEIVKLLGVGWRKLKGYSFDCGQRKTNFVTLGFNPTFPSLFFKSGIYQNASKVAITPSF